MLLLSLKAGGVGLNLVKANHVVLYDRWWNVAAENQAVDRAFRIGQTKNVFVHKFICSDTFEEKIDAMIEAKKEISDLTCGSGGKFMPAMHACCLLVALLDHVYPAAVVLILSMF